MGERAPCPYCTRGSTALTRRGLLAHHNGRYGIPCPAGGLTVEEARTKRDFDARLRNPRRLLPPRPTIKVMVGGETGEDGRGPCSDTRVREGEVYCCVLDDGHDLRHCFGEHRWGKLCDWKSTCPAPTPEAP